ncbi:MAG TPA: PadR family transcriptional regulator [Candidatus Paceibacterota bacterium]|nr:PadR family transcriptional regulator [Candidatus Paceibacterota bacterium]HPT18326.1 PadR family transcriptional regulator [Candidatus Paceibacterota bacterium]
MEQDDFQKSLDNAEAQMRKGVLEYAILLLIAKKKIYANEIILGLQNVHLVVVEGTIYPLLSRLKNSDLLKYTWEESKSGPPRKYYSITSKGQKFLDGCNNQWKNLEKAINILKK